MQSWIVGAGTGTAVVVAGLLAADLFLPIPSSLVMVLSGAAFGVVWGSLVALVGSIGGEWLGFELARRYGRRASARIVGDDEIDRLRRVFARHGVASLIGTTPIVVVYAYAGAVSREMGSVVPAVVITVAVAAFGWVLYRAQLSKE